MQCSWLKDVKALQRDYIAAEVTSKNPQESRMAPIISVQNLTKTYANGFEALKGINLDVEKGEILALLGPNGAGKTTLISIICGIANPSEGKILVGGEDIITSYRKARSLIG